ncbi:HEPN domain-containing protein, partial [Candidatus Dojkabacteria bacterium]|nr:HEPN domain-containing protein [Candidatus Dojkabacteria bacterium]
MSTAQSNIKQGEKPDRYKVWLKQAKFDLQAARKSHEGKFYEWACFQSEQSAEKALKAVLVHAGWRPPKMHKLSVLIGFCNHANDHFKRTKLNFHDLESFTFISRYPFLIPGNLNTPHEYISSSDSIHCINQADSIYSKVHLILENGANTFSDGEVQKIIDREKLIKRLDGAVKSLMRTFDLEDVYLFGSYARKENKPGSTIDLMIIA